MSENLRFDGRVAVITGAGGGLGRQYALMFASRGASVVVNDLGGDPHGKGKGTRAADLVVEEIRSSGGKAVPNYDSVENGESIINTAIEAFGSVDIVVNNAGILRDKSFARTSDEDWDLIQRVHLRGSFQVTRAAWPHMKKAKFGRIIMTSSAAGLYGNFGQANYSAAKMGLIGLANTASIEGNSSSIQCNTIVPVAGSRLTATVLPEDLLVKLKPEYVAPLVLYLCHESCQENGGIFEVGAGWVGQMRWEGSRGFSLRKPAPWNMTPEQVCDNWDKITDFTNSRHPENIEENMANLISIVQSDHESSEMKETAQKIDPQIDPSKKGLDRLIGMTFGPHNFTYTSRDVILYALGVGVSTTETDHLNFLYEGSDDFSPLPTFSIVPAQASSIGSILSRPDLNIDLPSVLHGEHYLENIAPLPSEGTLTSHTVVSDVIDKGKGALILLDVLTKTESGKLLARNQFTVYVSGAGGFAGKPNSPHQTLIVSVPTRDPDFTVEEKTSVDQAALYRLSGDINPLHIDPSFAAIGGLSQPILHGMCTFGIASRHVLRHFANNDVKQFKAMKVRFSKPVYPGQTIVSEMWREENRIHLQCRIKETGELCLSSGYLDLHFCSSDSLNKLTPVKRNLLSDVVFSEMSARLAAQPNLVKSVRAIFFWNIRKDGEVVAQWTLDLKNAPGSLYQGQPTIGKADCTLDLLDSDMFALATGKLNPQQAFMSGKLKIKGNIMLSQKLTSILKDQAKM